MKAFRFRLEPILRLRRHRLEHSRLVLARARESLRAATQLRSQAADALHEAQARRGERMTAGIPAGELQALEHALEHLLGRVARADAAVRTAESEVSSALTAVTSARREVRALEILRDKALAEHRRERERREQAELDETAGRMHGGTAW